MKKVGTSIRKQHSIETKNRIFQTALRLINEIGFENVSVDSIVEAAGVAKGSFYVHFESKDALAVELVNYYTNLADIDYKSYLATISEQKSVFDVLVLLAEKISGFLEDNIGYENMRLLYKAHLSKSNSSMPAMSYSRELYKMFIEVLEKGVRQGELRDDISVDSQARHLILAIRGITFEWCIRYPDFDLREQILDHFKILLYGLRK